LRINREIRASKVRVIAHDGSQLGILLLDEALRLAQEQEQDLIEIVPTADPPVCKIMDYGKFRYDQTKKEKESKKSQHQVKVKEVKVKPNIDDHDLEFKIKQARHFIESGDKVKLTCTYRGRELAHPEIGEAVVKRFCEALEDCTAVEAPAKLLGKSLTTVLAPASRKKR
jgi:translation initiation factor IF-3